MEIKIVFLLFQENNHLIVKVMLLLKNQTTKSVFNLPQTLDEVSFNYLKDCVKEVEIAPNLCIIKLKQCLTNNF